MLNTKAGIVSDVSTEIWPNAVREICLRNVVLSLVQERPPGASIFEPAAGALACNGGGDVCIEILRRQQEIAEQNTQAVRDAAWELFYAYVGEAALRAVIQIWRAARAATAAVEAAEATTTAHGAERIAGAAATRGGVLSVEEINVVRAGGQVLRQADGATVRVLANEGRFNVVVEGERGIITTFKNLSQKSHRPALAQLWVEITMGDGTVVCCFCGITLSESKAVLLVAFPTSERDESQNLYAHRACLKERIRPGVPLHPALLEEDDAR